MEQLFANRLEEYAPLLGRHFYEAGHYQPALKYYTLAGDEALRLYANDQAVAHYTRALACTRQSSVTGEQLRHLYTRRGRAQELSAEYEQALGNYEEMETRAMNAATRL
jgi:hypothetical protein